MSLNNFFLKNYKYKYSNILIYLFFLFFLIVGSLIYKGFGLSIDEPFHRTSGYFWFYILAKKIFPLWDQLVDLKNSIEQMEWSEQFFRGQFNEYGPLFDLFSVGLEKMFGITSAKGAYELKHLLTFLTFFISGIYFFKIISERFKNEIFSLLIVFFYFTSPRIFAESFYNCKDIIFMSFCIISIFYFFKSFEKNSFKNLILFSLFAAFATQIRIMGIQLIFFYLLYFFWQSLEEKKFLKKNFICLINTLFFYFLFLYIFWPFLWGNPIQNLIKTFLTFSNYEWGLKVFYLGKYINADNLPWHYTIVWIFITSPLIYIFFFLIGFGKTFKLFFNNLTSISEGNENKLWANNNQKKDFFIIFFLLTPILSVVLLNSTLYGGWRHLYFVYPSIIYLIAVGIEFSYFKIKKKISNKVIIIFISILVSYNFYTIIKLHPYQNIYFNSLVENKANKYFEIDYWGLANREALEFIIKDKNNGDLVTIRTASFTPLNYSKKIINIDEETYKFGGTTHANQDYIFTNYHYEKNPKYEKKYLIPKNYQKVFTIRRGNIIINEIYKKN